MVKQRSSSKQRLIDAAFEHFFIHGYEGASLSTIAEVVGIRKASIYTHFASKEALFRNLLQDAVEIESEYLQRCFIYNQSKYPGEHYLKHLQQRYQESITLRFLIRVAYVPPVTLVEMVSTSYLQYIQVAQSLFEQQFCQLFANKNQEIIQRYTDAYLGILDSLSVELLYAGDHYSRRLSAMLMLYMISIDNIY